MFNWWHTFAIGSCYRYYYRNQQVDVNFLGRSVTMQQDFFRRVLHGRFLCQTYLPSGTPDANFAVD